MGDYALSHLPRPVGGVEPADWFDTSFMGGDTLPVTPLAVATPPTHSGVESTVKRVSSPFLLSPFFESVSLAPMLHTQPRGCSVVRPTENNEERVCLRDSTLVNFVGTGLK